MLNRLSTLPRTQQVAIGGAIIGMLSAFTGWYDYTTGTTQVVVNGFRASLFGDAYFIAMGAVLLGFAVGWDGWHYRATSTRRG